MGPLFFGSVIFFSFMFFGQKVGVGEPPPRVIVVSPHHLLQVFSSLLKLAVLRVFTPLDNTGDQPVLK